MPTSNTKPQKEMKVRFAYQGIISVKESIDDIIVKGYIATTHFDGEDKITVDALNKWAQEINDGNPRANKVSVNHDRVPHVAGVGVKGTAKVEEFPDGEYGLFVETLIDKTREDFASIKSRIDNGMLDSFSIEYTSPSDPEMVDGVRILDDSTELFGWTLASQPMNEHAVMVKEMLKKKETDPQAEEETVVEEPKPEETEDKDKMSEAIIEAKTISPEDEKLLAEAKAQKANEEMLVKMKELLKDESLQKEIKGMEPDNKVMENKEGDEEEPEAPSEEEKTHKAISLQYKEVVESKEYDIREKFAKVGLLAEKKGLVWAEGHDKLGFKTTTQKEKGTEFKNFELKAGKLSYKAMGITTNQNTDTDYLLSSAELRDMFDPVIYDALNLSTTSWSLLRKDDYSQKGNNQVQFVMKVAANASRGFYTGNAIATGYTERIKYMTKFKKCAVGVAVDGDMVAAARGGPIGDVFGLEVADATEQLVNTANAALNDEIGLETASAVIGFEYITDSAGNTTLYNVTRSAANKLAPTAAGDTYITGSSARITLNNLRLAIEQARKEGASDGNLVFICHPTQERLFKGIYDSTQRTMPTSSRFGFEGRPEFDGVPVFTDKDVNTDDWFCVDLESHRLGIWVPPTLEMLGKRSDAEEGFIKMYFAVYNTAPRRMVQIHTNATS